MHSCQLLAVFIGFSAVHFSALNSGSRIELTQYEIPQIKEAHVIYHVRQYALFLDALHRLKALVGMQE